jgi:hypothetical protein
MVNKDNKQEKRKLKITIILLIIVVIMCSIGVTLALNKSSNVIVTTGTYNVIIEGDTTITPSSLVPIPNTSDTISYDNISTYSDYIYVSSFTVKGAEANPTEHNIIYDVALINQNIDTNLLNQYLKWELIKNGEIISNGNFSNLTNGTRYVLTTIQEDLPRYEDTADSLQLVIWINDNFDSSFDQTTMMNKTFSSTIDIELYTDSKVSSNLVEILKEEAVMDNIKSEYVTSSSGIDFSQISSDTNGKGVYILSSTANDTNPIYYFRGDVDNNNLIFANFCWKIVRTTETGGVKIIYNGTPTNNQCTNKTGTSTQIGTSKFNSSYNSTAYIGYMYGKVYTYSTKNMSSVSSSYNYGNSVTYSNGTYTLTNTISSSDWSSIYDGGLNNNHYTCFSTGTTCTQVYYIYYTDETYAYYITLTGGKKVEDALSEMLDYNTTSSTIKGSSTSSGSIDYWYYNNLRSYTNKLEDTVFCNDRTIYLKNGWDPDGGTTRDYLRFGTYGRLSSYKPSLTCTRDIDKFTVNTSNGNGELDYPVGLLTGDEITLAGARVWTDNSSYYLYTGQNWWAGSPCSFNYNGAVEFIVNSMGNLSLTTVNNANGARPVISLSPSTFISSGEGTLNNPYIVE